MRAVKAIHDSIYAPIADLETYRPMPTRNVGHIDPFLFLNHHGPQTYGPNNSGLPFGPHPHRGFETLTFILKGDIVHWDSNGHKSRIEAGGVQWMTAGRGLIHSEISSEEFKKKGGEEEIIQLWMNLPSEYKMTDPNYHGLTKNEIPKISKNNGNVIVELVSGEWNGKKGPINSLTNLTMACVRMNEGGHFSREIANENNILFYVVEGEVEVNGKTAQTHQLVEFENDHPLLEVTARKNSVIIFGFGKPFNEPIVAQGPFVMNTHEEIRQAMLDYQSGKMGTWD